MSLPQDLACSMLAFTLSPMRSDSNSPTDARIPSRRRPTGESSSTGSVAETTRMP
ncbi:MAG TPA: hypothetical protein PK955_02170 [Methanoregulaceae archaeon]|nr:hypothetical protein [Methanoregulaceae archaeon]